MRERGGVFRGAGAGREGPLPYRQLSRLGNELALSGSADMARLLNAGFDRGIVMLLLLRLAVPDWTVDGRVRVDRVVARPASINALAASLKRPFETVRRHVHALVEQGYCTIGPRGVAIDGTGPRRAAIEMLLTRVHDQLVRLIEDIAGLGHLPMPVRAATGSLLPAMLGIAIDVHLYPFEAFEGRIGDWTSMQLLMGIGVANTRHITIDPVLSARYAFDSTPDDRRRPASVQGVADMLGMARATAWRHRHKLAVGGLLVRQGDGWIIPASRLRDERLDSAVVAGVDYVMRRIGELIGLGLDPAAAATLYRGGRAAYVAVEGAFA